MANYSIKKIEHATGVDTSVLAAKNDFIALNAAVDNLGSNNLTNVPTSLGNLKTKEDNLDVRNLTNVPVDLKLLDINLEVVNAFKFNTLKTKVNSLEKNFLM